MDDVIWSCPDCDGDLERDSYGLWCPRCEQVVPYASLPLAEWEKELRDDF